MAIESLGLGSGVLTSDLVDKLVKAERSSSELRLTRNETITDAKITAYSKIRSLMAKLQSSVATLSDPEKTSVTKASSSDETILTATSGNSAAARDYSVNVLNTAKAHSLVTKTFNGFSEVVGSGKLVLSFGKITYDGSNQFQSFEANDKKTAKTINIDSSNNTLNGIRDAINNAKTGATASIVNDGSGYRLLLTSDDTGEQNAIRIEARNASGEKLTTGLAALAFNEDQKGVNNLSLSSKGEDARLNINGLNISRSSNEVKEAIEGVTLNLNNADAGKTVVVKVKADGDKLAKNIEEFVTAYNTLKKFVDDLSKYDQKKQSGGLLSGDSTIRGALSEIRSLIGQPIDGLLGNKYRSFTELGLNSDRNDGFSLKFSRQIFDKALKENRSSVTGILSKSGNTSDSQIRYLNDSVNTKPGSYDIKITQIATQAKYNGGSLDSLDFSAPVVINDSNDSFTINVDGKSAAVKLNHGSYVSGTDLAREISTRINSSANLVNSGKSVSVDYEATNKRFSITSNLYGSASEVSFTSVDTNVANSLGFNILGSGTHQSASLSSLNAEAFNGKGAITQIGNRAVDDNKGINFSSSNAAFSLKVDGAPAVAVTVNQKAEGTDLNGDGTFGDRKDTLQAIQTAIDATALNGKVVASFNKNGYLQFETTQKGSARSIEISASGNAASDVLLGLNAGQGAQNNGKDPGLTLSSPVEFKYQVDGITTNNKISVAAGTYATGADLATEIQNKINAALNVDPAFSGAVKGASTAAGSRDISTNIDFSASKAGFTLNVSGVEKEVVVNTDSGNNITDIQTALDGAFGAGVVTASQDGNGLKLTTVATGHSQSVSAVSDGRGTRSASFASLNTGIDFSGANAATFTLTVDGTDINVNVTGDGSSGSNDSASNLSVIQQALDTALVNSGQFSAGDIKANIDDSGKLFFETFSKQGVKTAATFGSAASLEIKNLGGTAVASLGLAAATATSGYDGFGLSNQKTFGYDLTTQVKYQYNAEQDTGSFQITTGGQATKVGFTELDTAAISFLGFQDVSVYSAKGAKGTDVAGTINGIEADGKGQFLRGVDGNVKAKNGFYIANALDFTNPLSINASNNKFILSIDGVDAEVQLNQPATYVSGEALAKALQAAIDNNTTFKSKDVGAKVEFTNNPASFAHNKLSFISKSTGKSSRVEVKEISSQASTAFGFVKGAGAGESGKDADGEIDQASGIRLKIIGGGIGKRGNVTYISGFADRLNDILSRFLKGKNSLLTVKESALKKDKENIKLDKERLNVRITAYETRLKNQFRANDAIIQKLKTTQDFIKQQFDAINAANQR